jgi:hypothetical protein
MTYRQGEIILASDFNTFRTAVLNVYDVGNGNVGYGQIDTGGQSTIPAVAIGEIIKSAEWERFRSAAEDCSVHQGSSTTFPPLSELSVGEIVEAHEADDGNAFDIDSSLTTVTTNSLLFDVGSVSTFPSILTSIRAASWSAQIQHRFTATFTTADDARYFFNSGGQIHFSGLRSGGSATSQNDSWTNLLDAMGTIQFTHNETLHPGVGLGFTVQPIGYYDLTNAFQQIAIGIPTGGYAGAYAYGSGNEVTIEARTVDGPDVGANSDNGRQLEFRVFYTDGHTGFSDTVDGTITSDIGYQKATSPLVIDTPGFSASILLTAGG